jgi:hypothetical protein
VREINFVSPGWRTRRGIAEGSRIAATRRTYGPRLLFNRRPVWTYMGLVGRAGSIPTAALLIGRTKIGDVYDISVFRVYRSLLSGPASVDDGGDLTLQLADWPPRTTLPVKVIAPWSRSTMIDGEARMDASGEGTATIAGSAIAGLLAERPPGTRGPVCLMARMETAEFDPALRLLPPKRVSVDVPLPPPPTLTASKALVVAPGDFTLTLAGLERSEYRLREEWSCPAARPTPTRCCSATSSRRAVP